jgi:hypothetical protein
MHECVVNIYANAGNRMSQMPELLVLATVSSTLPGRLRHRARGERQRDWISTGKEAPK